MRSSHVWSPWTSAPFAPGAIVSSTVRIDLVYIELDSRLRSLPGREPVVTSDRCDVRWASCERGKRARAGASTISDPRSAATARGEDGNGRGLGSSRGGARARSSAAGAAAVVVMATAGVSDHRRPPRSSSATARTSARTSACMTTHRIARVGRRPRESVKSVSSDGTAPD